MAGSSLENIELVVRTIAQTSMDNEKYFTDLDGVVGDGDFGTSLASGFGAILEQWGRPAGAQRSLEPIPA